MKSSKDISKRILLYRLGGIGDVVQTLPLVYYLRDEYKEANIEYITSRDISELLINCCPYINRVLVYEKKKEKGFLKKIFDLAELGARSGKVDYFFNLHSGLASFICNYFCFKTEKFFQYKKNRSLHAALNFVRTYNSSIHSSDLKTRTLFVEGSKDILSKYDLVEKKYICLVIGVGSIRPNRGWPLEYWLKLASKFLTLNEDYQIVLLGGKDEEKKLSSLDQNSCLFFLDKRAANLAGKLNLCEVAEVISNALLLVSCDTGLLHVASALDVACVGLYGPTSPKRSGPFTSNCVIVQAENCKCAKGGVDVKVCQETSNLDSYCMKHMGFEEVFTTVASYLKKLDLKHPGMKKMVL